MLFTVFQLLLLFSLFVFFAALSSSRILRGLLALTGALAIGFQLLSVFIGNSLIDYKFYAHFKLDIAESAESFFSDQVGIVLGIAAASGIAIYFLSGWLNRRVRPIGWMLWGAGVAVLLMSISGGVASNLFGIVKIHFAQQKQFRDALDNSGIKDYTLKKDVQATPGKNIIAIFMESVELGFLADNLAEISPNLRSLKKEMTFYPMSQNLGGDFTIGAIYTYLTGIPMYFKNHGNDVFETVADFELTSVGDVLNKAGYHQEYLAGNPSFAGTDVMLQLMGIEVKSERDYDPSYYVHPWGLHDRDLFNIVEGELDRLYDDHQPFAYYISTVSTHAVDGIYDERVLEDVTPKASKLELMTAALDHRIGQLIATLKSQNRLENTAIYIMPDHLLMGSSSRVMEDFADPRGLFLLTNTAPADYPNGTQINQTDVSGIMLQGAGVEHNMTLVADQIKGDPVAWLENNKLKLLQLNESALTRREKEDLVRVENGDEFELNDAQLRLVSRSWRDDNDGRASYIFDGKKLLTSPERGISVITLMADKFEVEHFDVYASVGQVDSLIDRLKQLREANVATWLLAHDSVGDHLGKRASILKELGYEILAEQQGRRAYVAFAHYGYVSEKTEAKTVNMTFGRTPSQPERSLEQRLTDANDPSRWIAHAGGAIDGVTYPNALEALDTSYAKGFRLFELDIIQTSDGVFVAAHDWEHWRGRCNYSGALPPTHADFLEQKILNKYTPLDMDRINEWFTAHPDATLITDKVNDPEAFAAAFVDKDRLMMELFTFQAIAKAHQLGIKQAIMTESLWNELEGDKVAALRDRDIQAMAVSINTVDTYPEVYRSLKKAGIKVYAFHIRGWGMKDEAYMARKGLDLAYGLYADFWKLEPKARKSR